MVILPLDSTATCLGHKSRLLMLISNFICYKNLVDQQNNLGSHFTQVLIDCVNHKFSANIWMYRYAFTFG